MTPNSFKARLSAGEPLSVLTVVLAEPAVVGIAAFAGVDCLMICCEHGSRRYERIEGMALAARGCGIAALARLPYPDEREVSRVLELGYTGIVMPHAESSEQVRRVIEAAYHPPRGSRSFATGTPAGRWGDYSSDKYIADQDSRVVIGVMIESTRGLDNLESLLSIPEVDLAYVGRSDLSLSMLGRIGPEDEQVIEATRRVAEACRRNNTAAMTYIRRPDQAPAFRDMGVQLLSITSDSGLWTAGLQQAVAGFREVFDKASPRGRSS